MDCLRSATKHVKFLNISEFSGKENILLIVPMVCFSNDMFGYVKGNVYRRWNCVEKSVLL